MTQEEIYSFLLDEINPNCIGDLVNNWFRASGDVALMNMVIKDFTGAEQEFKIIKERPVVATSRLLNIKLPKFLLGK